MRCEGSAVRLAGAGGESPAWDLLARHVAGCLGCQAEQARYRRMLRLLAQLRSEQAALRPGALANVVDAVAAAAAERAREATSSSPGRGRATFARSTTAFLAVAAAVIVVGACARLARQGGTARGCYR